MEFSCLKVVLLEKLQHIVDDLMAAGIQMDLVASAGIELHGDIGVAGFEIALVAGLHQLSVAAHRVVFAGDQENRQILRGAVVDLVGNAVPDRGEQIVEPLVGEGKAPTTEGKENSVRRVPISKP